MAFLEEPGTTMEGFSKVLLGLESSIESRVYCRDKLHSLEQSDIMVGVHHLPGNTSDSLVIGALDITIRWDGPREVKAHL